jgi:hypothetical protein
MIESSEVPGRFPDIEPFGYIIETLTRIGVALNSGNGVHGITWQELDSFVRMTRLRLTGWEAEIIKRLSAVYASNVLKYDNVDAPAPYRNEQERSRIASTMKSALRGIVIKDKHGSRNDTDQSRHQRRQER